VLPYLLYMISNIATLHFEQNIFQPFATVWSLTLVTMTTTKFFSSIL